MFVKKYIFVSFETYEYVKILHILSSFFPHNINSNGLGLRYLKLNFINFFTHFFHYFHYFQ